MGLILFIYSKKCKIIKNIAIKIIEPLLLWDEIIAILISFHFEIINNDFIFELYCNTSQHYWAHGQLHLNEVHQAKRLVESLVVFNVLEPMMWPCSGKARQVIVSDA